MSISFTVRGRGEFPIDMLRRNAATPIDEDSRKAIDATYDNGGDIGRRSVRLRSEDSHPLSFRWRSFGWPVIEKTADAVASSDGDVHPWTIAISVHHDGRIAKATMSCDRLDPNGQIVGMLAGTILDLTRNMPELHGMAHYLHNGCIGLVARMAAEIDGRQSEDFRSHRSKIAWMPGFDLEIEIS